ncbi:MAG: Crp/Fnr family transcriptional regulator [Thermoactinospora sp.]|nr:Crp/Fnr family transcriptional regulator [Thermoactinospora sp.]
MTSAQVTQFREDLRTFIARDSVEASSVRVPKRTNIYNCGQRDGNIYLVESGQIKTQMYARCGKECLLSIFTAGDIFGELSLLGPERFETATAMRTSWVRKIPAVRFRAALAESGLLDAFIDHLAQRLAEQQHVIATMVTMDSEQRLAFVLLNLSRKIGKRCAHNIRAIEDRITQEELSGMVGTTRSRVGYFLKRFKDAGFVLPTSEPFLLVDEKRLAEYVDVWPFF